MKGKHFRHARAGEAVYDASKHKGTDDGIESLIITVVCVRDGCVWICVCMNLALAI